MGWSSVQPESHDRFERLGIRARPVLMLLPVLLRWK
jgi:hypothetical protein